ncbi:hypothetical protein ACFOUV_11220 [Oceanobacillus longus]|uniref:Uncharacterized protein n=1 Tax=Oceanobacillus longus TaxID=930120 RepID=A0ABV8GWS8_9BACI
MGEHHSITITEQLLESEDFMYKRGVLQQYHHSLGSLDAALHALVHNIIVGENQKGEVVEAMQQETRSYMMRNQLLLNQLGNRVTRSVAALDDQIDDRKSQQLTLTYENTPSG